MSTKNTERDKRSHLVELLQEFDTAMLHTKTANGGVRSRPMGLAEVQEDGTVFLCARVGSTKLREIAADPKIEVSVQGKTKFASLSGNAKANHDRTLIHRLWKPDWKLWFPKGKDDPELCLVEFDAVEGEYWDNSGYSGVKFAIEAAKALLKGEEPDMESIDENAKVTF